jgi:acyl dehydratase
MLHYAATSLHTFSITALTTMTGNTNTPRCRDVRWHKPVQHSNKICITRYSS